MQARTRSLVLLGVVVHAVTVDGANFTPRPASGMSRPARDAWLGPVYAAQLSASQPEWLRLTDQPPDERPTGLPPIDQHAAQHVSPPECVLQLA